MAVNTRQLVKNVTVQYSDIADSFDPHPITGDVLMVTGVNSIVQSITNLAQLNHWDIPFHGEIGGNVRRLLFELADATTAGLLGEELTNVYANYEPRATNVQVYVSAEAGGNGWDVTVVFTPIGMSNPVSVSFFLERLR